MSWKKVTLIGVGLLGGSLGLALKRRGLARCVTGFVRRRESVAECKRCRAVDLATLDLREAVEGAGLIFLCTPILQMPALVKQMTPFLAPGAIVTDVGSVKGRVVRDLEKTVARAGGFFVGSHPMAGSEKTGVGAARADLFEGAITVVTPGKQPEAGAVRAVERLWRSVGSRVVRLNPEVHDQLVSWSSHLPHLVAAALANAVLDPKHPQQQGLLCANGFRDSTRIASGSPEMWRDIALANRSCLDRALAAFIRDLEKVRRLVARGDARRLEKFLAQAKARRDEWRVTARSVSPE